MVYLLFQGIESSCILSTRCFHTFMWHPSWLCTEQLINLASCNMYNCCPRTQYLVMDIYAYYSCYFQTKEYSAWLQIMMGTFSLPGSSLSEVLVALWYFTMGGFAIVFHNSDSSLYAIQSWAIFSNLNGFSSFPPNKFCIFVMSIMSLVNTFFFECFYYDL